MRILRPLTLRGLCLLVVVYSVVGAIVAPNPLATPATAMQALPRSIPQTDVNPLGATFFLDREVETWKKDHTLRMARDAGIGWVRQMFPWEAIEPRQGRFWDDRYRKSTWEKFDEIIDLAQRYNLRIVARLDRAPEWALTSTAGPGSLPVNLQWFGDYVYAVVSRYKGKIQHYQIWNEPNLAAEWGGRPVDPAAYVALLKVASSRAKEADPNALILSAPLAQTKETGPLNLNELDYLTEMYKAGAKPFFDILSANAYGFDRPPSDPPSRDTLNFQRVVLQREIMLKNDDGNKAVWLNEFAWNAAPQGFPESKLLWGRVTEEQQAAYTREALTIARSWEWMGVIGIWYFRQVGDILATDAADYYFRIVDVDFTPRLVYYELQKLAPDFLVAKGGIHEETHGAVETKGAWHPVLDATASDGALLASEQGGDTLTITFLGDELTLTYAKGPRFGDAAITIDGSPAPSLAKDRDGRTILGFFDPTPTARVRTKVAAGLSPGKHVLQMTVLPESTAGHPGSGASLDAFEVSGPGVSYGLFYRHLGLLGVGLVVFAASFVVRWPR